MPDNGLVTAAREVSLSQPVIRRLARLHARVEGMQQIANLATQSVQLAQNQLRDALAEACEEQGATLPESENAPVNIDWRTGVVTISPPESAPSAPLGEPMARPAF
jgi:hypothetical protein